MLKRTAIRVLAAGLALLLVVAFAGCGEGETESGSITELSQLDGKVFAVPSGTVADQLVLSRFPDATFNYYDSALDACLAVKAGEADAAAYDEPILRNIAAKNEGLTVLPDMITVDDYGFAVQLGNIDFKAAVDRVVARLKSDGTYDQMLDRWLPEKGAPAAMPQINFAGDRGILRFGTAAVTEPFSYKDANGKIVGFDIELASYVAQELGMQLEVVDMDFGEMIPALTAGEVEMIGACITITDERAKSILFSSPYYQGGIAALVRE